MAIGPGLHLSVKVSPRKGSQKRKGRGCGTSDPCPQRMRSAGQYGEAGGSTHELALANSTGREDSVRLTRHLASGFASPVERSGGLSF
jgi:hypothetical protein